MSNPAASFEPYPPAPARSRLPDARIDGRRRGRGAGDVLALTQLLASDVRVVTDGGGKVAAALNTIDGFDRAARLRNPEKLRHLNG